MSTQLFEILVTTLLTIIIGLNTWMLKTVLDLLRATARLSQQVWGVDGQNGHASELRSLRKSFNRIERYISKLGFRLQRVEERLGMDSGEHPRFQSDDDKEEDS